MAGIERSLRVGSSVPLLLGSASYACFTFVWFALAAYLPPIVESLDISNAAAGLVVGAVPLTYVPFALLSGLLIDRIGPRRAIGAGLLFIGLGQAGRSFADGLPALFVLTVAIGLGGTGITFGLPKLVAVLFPARQAGKASSVYMIGSHAGIAAAFSLGRPVLGPLLGGWRPLFLWSGLFVAGVSLLWFLDVAPAPPDRRGGPLADGDRSSIREDVRTILAHRGMRLLVVVGAMSLFVVHGTFGWLTAILEFRGFVPTIAATAATVLVVARLAGTVTLPPISDRTGARRGVLVGSGGLLAVGLGSLIVTGTTTWPTFGAAVAVGLGLGGLLTLIRVLPIEYAAIGPGLTGTATGLLYSVGQVGGFVGPLLLGSLFDVTGTYTAGLTLLLGAACVIVVASATMPAIDG